MPLCFWVVVSVTQPLNKLTPHQGECKPQWHWIPGVLQKTTRHRWDSSEHNASMLHWPEGLRDLSDEASQHVHKHGEDDHAQQTLRKPYLLLFRWMHWLCVSFLSSLWLQWDFSHIFACLNNQSSVSLITCASYSCWPCLLPQLQTSVLSR